MKKSINYNNIFRYNNGDHSSVNLFISDGSLPVYIMRLHYNLFMEGFNIKICLLAKDTLISDIN